LNTYHRGLELNADATETTETTPVDNTTNYVKTAPNGVTTNGVHEEEDREIAPVVGTAAATGAAAAVTAAGRVPVVTKVDDAPIQVDSKVTESINEIQPVKEEVTKSKPQEDPAVKKEDETLQKKEEVKEKSVEPEKPKPAAATKPTPAAATKPTATAAKKEEKSKCFCM
jgi:hypothetical protein